MIEKEIFPKSFFSFANLSVKIHSSYRSTGNVSHKIKKSTWYEVEGYIERNKDLSGHDIFPITVVNIKEIDGSNEEEYRRVQKIRQIKYHTVKILSFGHFTLGEEKTVFPFLTRLASPFSMRISSPPKTFASITHFSSPSPLEKFHTSSG